MNSEKPTCVVVERPDQIAGCVGQIVTLRGIVTRTKIPSILGVDVEAAYALSDREAEATGRLETYEIAPQDPDGLAVQSKGPGKYYRLVDTGDGRATARAR